MSDVTQNAVAARRDSGPVERIAEKRARRLARIEWLAHNMDSKFSLFGFRFGFDALAGIVPGIGDTLTSLVSGAIVYDAWKLGLPAHKLVRMAGNIAADTVLGVVPVLGDLIDAGWKANKRNARLVRAHLDDEAGKDAARNMRT